jgi:hypothetical protein
MNPPYSVHRLKSQIVLALKNTLYAALTDLTIKVRTNIKIPNHDKNYLFISTFISNINVRVFEVRCETIN